MKALYLKFDSKTHADETLLSNGFTMIKDGSLHCDNVSLDVIGVIPGHVTYDAEGNILSQEPDLPGWHVNLLVPDNFSLDLSRYSVINIKTPYRTWAGYEGRARV